MSFDKCMCWNQRVSRAPNKNHVCMENVFFFFPSVNCMENEKWKMLTSTASVLVWKMLTSTAGCLLST